MTHHRRLVGDEVRSMWIASEGVARGGGAKGCAVQKGLLLPTLNRIGSEGGGSLVLIADLCVHLQVWLLFLSRETQK